MNKILDDVAELDALEASPHFEITGIKLMHGQRYFHVTYKPIKEPFSKNGNVILAAFTTAYARIKLWKLIHKYSEQIIYFDTDSILLLLKDGEDRPDSNDLLGELKDEIEDKYGKHHHIRAFYATGPKCYCLEVVNAAGEVVDRVQRMKGIRYTVAAQELLSNEAILGIVENKDVVSVPQFNFKRDVIKGPGGTCTGKRARSRGWS